MAADELLSNGSRDALAALLFIAASTNTVDVYSAVNSSPWTSESFGGDPEKAESCRRYVRHAVVLSLGYGVASTLIAQSVWPLIGTAVANAYMYWLYASALDKAADRGSSGWDG